MLTKEQQLLLMLSRLSIKDEEKEEIKILANSKDFNWFEFLRYTLYHRTGALCWKNMHTMQISSFIPHYIDDLLCYIYLGNKKRNEYMEKEKDKILAAFQQNNIPIVPVKGAMLIPNLYRDYGLRYSSDFDFLIRNCDTDRLPEVMTSLGYVQGVFDRATMEVIAAKKKTLLKHRIYLSNEHPYVKHSGIDLFISFGVDFRFALGYERKCEPINDMVTFFFGNGYVPTCYYLLHLCVHFYEEVKQGVDILLGKDINMIKLCDIREFILQYKVDMDGFIEICFHYNLNKEIYLTLYYLKMVFDDGYENKWMDALKIEDDSFIYKFGTQVGKDNIVFRKGFWERFFSCYNLDEIPDLDDVAAQL